MLKVVGVVLMAAGALPLILAIAELQRGTLGLEVELTGALAGGGLVLLGVGFWAAHMADRRDAAAEEDLAERLSFIDGYEFPGTVIEHFRKAHPELDQHGVLQVQAATRQWFRAIPRYDCAGGLPSIAVDHLWREFAQHARYAEFCTSAFGWFESHRPAVDETRIDRGGDVWLALDSAQDDEPPKDQRRLPLLFRVDTEVEISGGRSYVYCDGEDEVCQAPFDVVCVRHRIAIAEGGQPAGGYAGSGWGWGWFGGWFGDGGGGDGDGGDGGDGGGGGDGGRRGRRRRWRWRGMTAKPLGDLLALVYRGQVRLHRTQDVQGESLLPRRETGKQLDGLAHLRRQVVIRLIRLVDRGAVRCPSCVVPSDDPGELREHLLGHVVGELAHGLDRRDGVIDDLECFVAVFGVERVEDGVEPSDEVVEVLVRGVAGHGRSCSAAATSASNACPSAFAVGRLSPEYPFIMTATSTRPAEQWSFSWSVHQGCGWWAWVVVVMPADAPTIDGC